jgi:hypothetical protein
MFAAHSLAAESQKQKPPFATASRRILGPAQHPMQWVAWVAAADQTTGAWN